MNLLEIIQRFTTRSGLGKPPVAILSNDASITQMVALVEEIIEDLSITRAKWTEQTRELVHTTIANENQGNLRVLCPGFQSIIVNTMYNRSKDLPIVGPFDEAEWQSAKSTEYMSAYSKFRIWQGNLFLYPTPAPNEVISFEYKTNYLIQDADDLSYKEYFTKDTDQFLLQSSLAIQGLRYLWKREKGQPYAEEFAIYERLVLAMEATDRVARDISMSGSSDSYKPGILVPDSNWQISNS